MAHLHDAPAVGGGFAAAEGTPPLPALTLRLEPLPADDAKTLVRAAAGDRRLTDEELAALMERGAGNPLFLRELASPEQAREAAEQMPDTVEALVATRIDRLAPGDRALLRWASVLGVSFSGALIADVLDEDPTAASDSEAWGRLGEFVERDPDVPGAFRFRHALIRDGAYEGLSYRRRRELHARVAAVLEERTTEAGELLSLHYYRADDRPRRGGTPSRPAERGGEMGELEAAEFYRAGTRRRAERPELEPRRDRECLGGARGLSCSSPASSTRPRSAFAAARELRRRNAQSRSSSCVKEGLLRERHGPYYGGSPPGTAAGSRRPRRLADGRIARALESSSARACAVPVPAGRVQGLHPPCQEVVAGGPRGRRPREPRARIPAPPPRHTQLGSPERAAFRGLALPLYEELGDLEGPGEGLNNLGVEAYYDGDWARPSTLYERSRALLERIGDVTNVAMTANNIGEILSDQGRLEEADRSSRRSCEHPTRGAIDL